MDKKEIVKIYTLINGIYLGIKESKDSLISRSIVSKYNLLLNRLYIILVDEYIGFWKIGQDDMGNYSGEMQCRKEVFLLKIVPALEYINKIYIDTTDETIQKVGALYNAIEDIELQKRCGDILLVASDKFDRVINQATQVLEDRIKKKARLEKTTLTGRVLISKAIHSKLDETILKFTDTPDIQESYSGLFKGIIGVYRNLTHHGTDYECTREDALKFCAYIDTLLVMIEESECVEK